MIVKPGHKSVEMDGTVHTPYLLAWNANSRLAELVKVMSTVFSADPPLFTRPPGYTYHSPLSSSSSTAAVHATSIVSVVCHLPMYLLFANFFPWSLCIAHMFGMCLCVCVLLQISYDMYALLSSYMLIDWLLVCVTDWLINWLSDWLTDWLIVCVVVLY